MNRWCQSTALASVLILGVGGAGLGAMQLWSRPALSASVAADPPVVVAPAAQPPTAVPSAAVTARVLPLSLTPSRASALDSWAVSATAADAATTTTASVTVRPALGSPLDRFAFVLSGFAAHERVIISFRPPDEALEFVGVPDDAATMVDEAGAGRFELIAAEQWGPTAPGDYTVRFHGELSGAVQALTISFICGC